MDSLRLALKLYKELQLALQALQGLAISQDVTTIITERDWIRRYVLCSGKATNGTRLLVNDLGYNKGYKPI